MVYRLQVVLVNRLVLNLNHAANAREDSVESDLEFWSRNNLEPPTLIFAEDALLGDINLGGPVHSLLDEFYDGDVVGNTGRNGAPVVSNASANRGSLLE